MSEQSSTFQPTRKRPGESSGSDLVPMETEDSGDTASEHANGNQTKKSDSNETEKSEVDIFYCPTTLVSSKASLG